VQQVWNATDGTDVLGVATAWSITRYAVLGLSKELQIFHYGWYSFEISYRKGA
jgi:hypothetical protein